MSGGEFFHGNDRGPWLAWRKQGIGASDVAALVGMSPFASPMSVYMDKQGLTTDEDSDYMEFGRRAEPMITGYFEDRTGLHIVDQQACVTHPDNSHHRATLDGRVCEHPDGDPIGLAEYKTTGSFGGEWSDGGYPDAYAIQVQWQLHVDQQDHAWLAVLRDRRFQFWEIERDQKSIDMLIDVVDRFWFDHVVPMVPPPADAHKATARALKDAYPEPVEGAAVPLDDVLSAIDAREQAKEQLAAAKVELARAENTIKAAIGDAEIGTISGEPILTYKKQKRDGYTVKPGEFRQLRMIGAKS